MADKVEIAIIGSGPAGLSAAARAAVLGVSHVLLERTDHAADTIYKYQKKKFVMATPDNWELRSDLPFQEGIREDILDGWDAGIEKHGVNIRYNAEVVKIEGEKGNFTISVRGGEAVEANHVILSMGMQGNIRKFRVPGAEWDRVGYQVDDPDDYKGEIIFLVGAGDAAIENAVALARQNDVTLINRRDEFARAKPGNVSLVLDAARTNELEILYGSEPSKIEPGAIWIKTADGEEKFNCDRVIGRLGASPPRQFLESCGLAFVSDGPESLPVVSETLESTVPGIYLAGALAGQPLIKQAMNQGYEIVHTIIGQPVEPMSNGILQQNLKALGAATVDDAMRLISDRVPLLSQMSLSQMKDVLIDTIAHAKRRGEVVFERNDHTNTVFSIVSGSVAIQLDPNDPSDVVVLGEGNFFGEMGLISGRRRSATIVAHEDCLLVETPRTSMIRLLGDVPEARKVLDNAAVARQIQTHLAPDIDPALLREVIETSEIQRFSKFDTVIKEGDTTDDVFLVRSGSMMVSKDVGGKEIVKAYVPAGNYVGEMSLLNDQPRSATVKAAIKTEAIKIDAAAFRRLLDQEPSLRGSIEKRVRERTMQNVVAEGRADGGRQISDLLVSGAGEATDMLLIDEALCVRCDNCEKACAETHNGISRLDREAGPTYGTIHVPTSCRHCEHPHCMKDCPPDAIQRAPSGEVFINDSCIGCGNCAKYCPYDVIHMAYQKPKKPGLLAWLLFGAGPGPGEDKRKMEKPAGAKEVAVKCDMCLNVPGGAACVSACPTGAALRVKPEEFFSIANLAAMEG